MPQDATALGQYHIARAAYNHKFLKIGRGGVSRRKVARQMGIRREIKGPVISDTAELRSVYSSLIERGAPSEMAIVWRPPCTARSVAKLSLNRG